MAFCLFVAGILGSAILTKLMTSDHLCPDMWKNIKKKKY